jgi:uracil-DNA glycosylase family 4
MPMTKDDPFVGLPAVARPLCNKCPFADCGRPRHRPVLGSLPTQPAIGVLVGEGPGEVEVQTGRPFTGPTGRALDVHLADQGLPRSRLAIINATACLPPTGFKTPASLSAATKCCAPLFNEQARRLRNLPALGMGSAAGQAWSGKKRAVQGGKNVARGFVRPSPVAAEGQAGASSQWILTWHPSFALFKSPWNRGEFLADLARFGRLVRGELEAEPIVIPATPKNLASLIEEQRDLKQPLACDIETGPGRGMPAHTGKDPTRASLRCIGFGSVTRGLVFMAGEQSPLVRATLKDPALTKVFMNGEFFDKPVLKRHVFPVVNTVDIREKRYVLAPESRLSLGYQASLYCDVPPWKEEEGEGEDEAGKGHRRWDTDDVNALKKYCAWDCVITARINRAEDAELEAHS